MPVTGIAFAFPLANGLHARPASLLRDACRPFKATVVLRNQRSRRSADAASVLELVASDTQANDPCLLEISGPQEKEAARALRIFLNRELPHADDDLPPPAASSGRPAWLPPVFQQGAAHVCPGRTIAPGIGRGRAVRLQPAAPMPRRFAAGKGDAKKELQLFEKACLEVENDLQKKAAAEEPHAAGIINAHLAILADRGFRKRIGDLIAKGKRSAGLALSETTAHYVRLLEKTRSVYLRERVSDLQDLAAQLGEKLYGPSHPKAQPSLRSPGVVVAASLFPSELLALERRYLRGLVVGDIGLTSHTAILARSLAIPAVSLPPTALARVPDGVEVIVDGRRGLAIVSPGTELKRYYRLEQQATEMRRQRLARLTRRPATTRDGIRVEIAANIGTPAELAGAWRNGAEGVGLFRSEFLFLGREAPPGEEEQLAAYLQAARSAGKRRVIFRTLDIGGDKPLPYLGLPREENPFLGCRAVRFYREHEDLIRCQLRALLRATARSGCLRVMVPMVATVAEVRLARRLLAEAVAELRRRRVYHARRIELGIMVETPAAALAIDNLAREAAFFSVGSNDLLQYVMAVDRGNAALAGLYDPLQPAFLRLLQQAARQARQAKHWLGICGEMAGDSELLPLLVGIGFDELSMAPPLLPAVRERLAQLDGSECRALLRRALKAEDADAARALLREFNGRGSGAGVIAAELVRLDSKSRTPSEAIKELCTLLELEGRVGDAMQLEEAVWKREQTCATDLGLGFAIPHGKSDTVRSASIAFLRPSRPLRWGGKGSPPVKGVLLIAIPAAARGEEHLRLIAGLSRRLMHEDFRAALLAARDASALVSLVNGCLRSAV